MVRRTWWRLFRATVGVTALMSVTAAARPAVFEDGNTLYTRCTAQSANVFNFTLCRGYMVGIYDAMTIGPVAGVTACFPSGVTPDQQRDVVVKYLREHPEIRTYTAAGLVASAFATGR
jgi:hypothetical protein